MKRILIILLALLLLCGCTAQQTLNRPAVPPSADEVAQAVLAVCEEVNAEPITGDALDLWLTEFYRLPDGSWNDAAVYRAADPMSAFEISVIRLSGTANDMEVMYRLEDYQYEREGDFFGYDPEQAALVSGAMVCCSDNIMYAALLICKNPPDAAQALSEAAARPASRTPSLPPSSVPEEKPDPTATPTPAGEPYTPPISHEMDIYDSTPILEAWQKEDPSALSGYDRAIYDRCRQILPDILEDGMSDLEKERAIYLWIVRHIVYDFDHYDNLKGASLNSSTPYNPLVNGKGICMGFATTFQLLADLAGLESMIVPGTAFSQRENHAWNMIRLNGQWYCLDCTWDVGKSNPRFWTYFNITSERMKQTEHQWDYDAFPSATANDHGDP